ncbi:conserved hypothetical protein [Acidianus hospitalis W1]|uniref:Uncharacterized protein n=1 Tax=Acidianus hospitalis (strain W1) TaxID=933801 RepID=F4B9Q3_ACIHW|nr:hypothetical protein [Acidianus hospitalis]AEE93969.1 conserved hypothetical protein [Acidianus hospitalis W1]
MLDTLWRIIDLQLPLVKSDVETFLIKDGEITEDDLKIFNEASELIKKAYYSAEKDPNSARNLVKEALTKLESIKPKKPFPPEMRIRFDELKSSLMEVLGENKVSQTTPPKS